MSEFDLYELEFNYFGRVFTLPELRRCVISYEPDTPFTTWGVVQNWLVGDCIELLEELAQQRQPG